MWNEIYCHVACVIIINKLKDDDCIEWEGDVSQMTEMSKGSVRKITMPLLCITVLVRWFQINWSYTNQAPRLRKTKT